MAAHANLLADPPAPSESPTVYLTRHFVFVHIPKTGGTFVNAVLDQAPAEWEVQRLPAHTEYTGIPASHRHLPRLAFARNPYSWYVSWFTFQQKTRSDFYLQISDGGRLDFLPVMHRVFGPGGQFEHSFGPFSQTLLEMLGPGLEGTTLGKLETLRADLRRIVSGWTPLPPAVAAAIDSMPALNASEHRHYSSYYDDALRRIVRERDAAAFEFFGYEWEDGPRG